VRANVSKRLVCDFEFPSNLKLRVRFFDSEARVAGVAGVLDQASGLGH
jgi:hypothetical protein